jgi:hypothetical protein
MHRSHKIKHERGNVLFLILIAVALFAALSYAVTQSTRGGGDAGSEKSELLISEMLNHFTSVKTAVTRLRLSGQCTEKELRFWHSTRANAGNSGYYGDNSNLACQVFDSSGGGVAYQLPPQEVQNIGGTEYMVMSQGVGGLGSDTTANDSDGQGIGIDLVIATNVTRETCLAMNDREGITNTSGEPPHRGVSDWYISPGRNFILMPSNATGGFMTGGLAFWSNSEIYGHATGCLSYESSMAVTYYVLYSALLER